MTQVKSAELELATMHFRTRALPAMHKARFRLTVPLLLFTLLLGSGATPAVVPPGWDPKPGDYLWKPELSPQGPMVIVVSLPLQQLHVYRNGVRIAASTISSGKPGHETPTGVFTILQKRAEHYSNLYDNAPMPWMQRLTWDGVALHAGRLPGQPASHGCIRLPDAFAKALFLATRTGDVVMVTDRAVPPGITTGADAPIEVAIQSRVPGAGDFWAPERAPEGPVSVVLSTADQRLVVTRNGRRIGQAALRIDPALRVGTQALMLLDGKGDGANPVLPERSARRWMAIDLDGQPGAAQTLANAIETRRLEIPVEAARRIDDVLRIGSTVVVTDAPLGDETAVGQIELEQAGVR